MALGRAKGLSRPRKGDVATDKAVYDTIRRAMLMGRRCPAPSSPSLRSPAC